MHFMSLSKDHLSRKKPLSTFLIPFYLKSDHLIIFEIAIQLKIKLKKYVFNHFQNFMI
jgi:hypothetical protein